MNRSKLLPNSFDVTGTKPVGLLKDMLTSIEAVGNDLLVLGEIFASLCGQAGWLSATTEDAASGGEKSLQRARVR